MMAITMHNRASRLGHATMLRNLLPAYLALEQALEQHRNTPGVGRFARPETYRAAAIAQDLLALAGADWRFSLPVLPEAGAYAAAVARAGAGDGAILIAHAYTRALGDLSGGQMMRAALARSLDLPAGHLNFYSFPAIADMEAYKADFRRDLDLAGDEILDMDRVTAEAKVAFAHNISVSNAVAALHQPAL